MPIRVLTNASPPTARFPRWGYLDKYAVDEYLARAFLLTVAIVATLGLAARLWLGPAGARSAAVPVAPPSPRAYEVSIEPPPSIRPNAVRRGGGGLALVAPRLRTPVPVRAPVIEVEALEAGSGAGAAVEGATAPAVEGPGAIGVVEEAPRWPSPDEIVVVEREPELIAMQAPAYPEIARDAGIEGTVLVRVLVDPRGSVRDALILQGVRGLEEAALAAATTAVFRPALQQDRPVAVWVVVPIEFRLRD